MKSNSCFVNQTGKCICISLLCFCQYYSWLVKLVDQIQHISTNSLYIGQTLQNGSAMFLQNLNAVVGVQGLHVCGQTSFSLFGGCPLQSFALPTVYMRTRDAKLCRIACNEKSSNVEDCKTSISCEDKTVQQPVAADSLQMMPKASHCLFLAMWI